MGKPVKYQIPSRVLCAVSILAVALRAQGLLADTVTWVGDYETSPYWQIYGTPQPQWSTDALPQPTDDVLLNSFGGEETLMNSPLTIAGFTFDAPTGAGFLLGDSVNTLTFSGALVALGSSFPSTGTFSFGLMSTTNRLATQFTGSSTISVPDSGQTMIFWGAVGGDGAIDKTGDGQLDLRVDNSYSGTLTVSGGTVLALSNGALADADIVMEANTTIGIPTASATAPVLGSICSTESTSTISFGNATYATLTVGNSSSTTFEGLINDGLHGYGTLKKIGSGTLTLTNIFNAWTGGTQIFGGTISVDDDGELGTSPATVMAANIVLNGGTLLANGTFTLSSNRGIVLGPVGSSGSGTLDASGSAILTYAGIIADNASATGSLIKGPGTGTVIIGSANPNTYSGSTTIQGGTVQIAVDNALPTTTTLTVDSGASAGGTLDLDGHDQSVAGLFGGSSTVSGVVTDSAATTTSTMTVSGTSAFHGVIQDGGGTTALAVTGGTFTLAGTANTYSGGTTISSGATLAISTAGALPDSGAVANNGTFEINASETNTAGAITGTGDMTVAASDSLTAASITQGSLTIDGTAVIAATTVNSGNTYATTSVLGSLSIAGGSTPTGTLNLNNNRMIITDGGAAARDAVTADITNARNGGLWNQPGITSSNAQAAYATNHFDAETLGVVLNSDLPTPYTSFEGDAVGSNDVLVKFTYGGDADLDGTINGNDYFQIDRGFLNHYTGWVNGDFNYDGVINGNDYFIIDSNFIDQSGPLARTKVLMHAGWFGPAYLTEFTTTQLADIGESDMALATFAPSQLAAIEVPEPASLAVLSLGTIGFLIRRRR